MRPEDETPDRDEPAEGTDEHAEAGEHEVPPPSTWAGRERAAAGGEEKPEDSGFTEEFDEIDRELDAELEGLGNGDEI